MNSNMLCVFDLREFAPAGRAYTACHPREVHPSSAGGSDNLWGSGIPSLHLSKAFGEVSLQDQVKDWWMLRESNELGGEEELYVNKNIVVWSRTTLEGTSNVLYSYTMDTPVLQAMWCNFLLPVERPLHKDGVKNLQEDRSSVDMRVQRSVCVIEGAGKCEHRVTVFTSDGRDYMTTVQFPVAKAWVIRNGMLIERAVSRSKSDVSKTPSKSRDGSSPALPVLFSMMHPLDDISPVICRTGGKSAASKVSLVTEVTQQIVYTHEEPSLVVTYDKLVSAHTVWAQRLAYPEEINSVYKNMVEGVISSGSVSRMGTRSGFGTSTGSGNNSSQGLLGTRSGTPGRFTQSSLFSRLTLSSFSPSGAVSPLQSRVNSPLGSASLARLCSPSMSRLAQSRMQSPSTSSLYKLHTPSPHNHSPHISTPSTPFTSPMGRPGVMMDATGDKELIAPEVCLDHVWTEPGNLPRDGPLGCASKVFIMKDLCEQHFLCYLVSFRQQLRCVKFDKSNDERCLIFGALSLLPARDAAVLTNLKMMLVTEKNGTLVLYSGVTKMTCIHVTGLALPLPISSKSFHSKLMFTASSSPERRSLGSRSTSLGPTTSSRPASAMDAHFDDDVRLLSPVPKEIDDSLVVNTSFADDFGFPSMLPDTLSQRPSFPPETLSQRPSFPPETLSQRPSFPENSVSNAATIENLRDPVDNRITLVAADGAHHRITLPRMEASPIISACLSALRQVLPRDTAMQVLIRCYCMQNVPGSVNGQSACMQYLRCLLKLMGYDTTRIQLSNEISNDSSLSQAAVSKKPRTSDQSGNKDWKYLLTSQHHNLVRQGLGAVMGLEEDVFPPLCGADQDESDLTGAGNGQEESHSGGADLVDSAALLFPYIPTLLFALHLVYEDLKLDATVQGEIQQLAAFLVQLARDLGCTQYVDHYCRDHPYLFTWLSHQGEPAISPEDLGRMTQPSYMRPEPPHLHYWLCRLMKGQSCPPFPYLPGVSDKTMHVIAMYVAIFSKEKLEDLSWAQVLRKISVAGHRSDDFEVGVMKRFNAAPTRTCWERVVLYLSQLDGNFLEGLQCGVALPLWEAIHSCRHNPPTCWPQHAHKLIGREDLLLQYKMEQTHQAPVNPGHLDNAPQVNLSKEEEDGMDNVNTELLKLMFSEDLRVQELRHLLQSARPVRIAIKQRPEVSDHDFIEEQERHLYATCIRTMALPLGRGLFTLCTACPVPTETLPIPKLCLTGRSAPRNTLVDLTHIDTPANMSHWPQFHNGVAAGLRVANSSQLDSTWILYNKPRSNNDLPNDHAGFLMGLGLNGHLKNLALLSIHDYLIRGDEMTSVGLLLGVSAGMRGTMHQGTTKLLSIHIAALLPPTSIELDVAHNVQVSAVMGIGLLYQGTGHSHMANVLLSEIGRPPGPEMENCNDRESYSLAAGLALGLVMLKKGGGELGFSERNMADQLSHYMLGGQKRPLTGAYKERYKSPSYQIKEGDGVNVDVTGPGATLALGLMFFNTANRAVAEWLLAPDTPTLLDGVRPDFLMLRIISRGLVLWDHIHPSEEWINSNIPHTVLQYAFQKAQHNSNPDCDIDFETMSQAYCNIIAGACFVLGLRFAGSGNEMAFKCMYEKARELLRLLSKPSLAEQANKSTVESCLSVTVLALSMVMAGRGRLEVMRLCRHLRSRVGQAHAHVLYGSHMAISMSLGLLFIGGGRYSLSTSPESVAAMLCAFFPKFPIHSNDNRYHLQALRHLYVLALEPRILQTRDVESNLLCYVPLRITFKASQWYGEQTYTDMAPCILPELHLIKKIEVLGPRYWPVEFHQDQNWKMLMKILVEGGTLFVTQRAGHLSYVADPKGYHGVLAQSLTKGQTMGRVVKPEDIKSFSSDPRILLFAEYFCSDIRDEDYETMQFLSQVLHECVSHEKLDVLPTYVFLHSAVTSLTNRQSSSSLQLWQLKLLLAYCKPSSATDQTTRKLPAGGKPGVNPSPLISEEFLLGLQGQVEHYFQSVITEERDSIVHYLSGEDVPHVQLTSGSASMVSWYDIPHPAHLNQLVRPGQSASFPHLCRSLLPHKIPVCAIRVLASLLSPLAS